MLKQGYKELKKNKKQGLSLPFVACAGTFLIAFALALVYTAGLMMANANNKLEEERCYQLAKSYSKVIEKELKTAEEGNNFYKFANKFLNDSLYNEYNPDKPETVYRYKAAGTEDGEYGTIELRLKKEINEADTVGFTGTMEPPASGIDQSEKITNLQTTRFQRYILRVEVIAKHSGQSYNYETEYYREDTYPVEFQYNGQKIVWDKAEKIWKVGNDTGDPCNFNIDGEQISYTYDVTKPTGVNFIPVHEEQE